MIEHPSQKLFHTLLSLVNLSVSTMMSVIVEEWNELGLKCHPCHVAKFGEFCKNFYTEIFHGLTLLHRSLIVTHVYLLTRACLYSALDMAGICGVWKGSKRYLLDSNLLQNQRLDP